MRILLILLLLVGCSHSDPQWTSAQRDYAESCAQSETASHAYTDCGEGFAKYYANWSKEKTDYAQFCAEIDWTIDRYDECGTEYDEILLDREVERCLEDYYALPIIDEEVVLTPDEARRGCVFLVRKI